MISFIVPVYNAEKYISTCIESIINQSYKDFEIIIINDGSIDNSISIVREYSKIDTRIKIINKENTGVSDSRNQGLSIASGEYISFIDADDWIEADYIEKIVQCLNKYNPDILFNGWIEDSDKNVNARRFQKKDFCLMTKREALIELCEQKLFGWAPFGTFYRYEAIRDIRYDTNICFGEDLDFKYKSIMKSKGMLIYAPINKYHYVRRDTSVTVNYNISKKYDDIRVIMHIIEEVESEVADILYYNELVPRELNYIFLGAVSNNKADKEILLLCKEDILKNWWSLMFSFKLKLTTRIKLLFSITPLCKYFGKLYKLKKGYS